MWHLFTSVYMLLLQRRDESLGKHVLLLSFSFRVTLSLCKPAKTVLTDFILTYIPRASHYSNTIFATDMAVYLHSVIIKCLVTC